MDAILGLVVLVPIIIGYVYINSLIGFPILGIFLGGILLHVFALLLVNAASIYVAFRIKKYENGRYLIDSMCCRHIGSSYLLRNSILCFILYCRSTCSKRETDVFHLNPQ
jgi:hypothetical protein